MQIFHYGISSCKSLFNISSLVSSYIIKKYASLNENFFLNNMTKFTTKIDNVNHKICNQQKIFSQDTSKVQLESTLNMLSKFNKGSFLSTNKRLPLTRQFQNYRNRRGAPKTPDLIYVPHILRWLRSKLKFKYLQKTWDPEFSEGAFIYGSIHALCRITEIIHRDEPQKLEGLLTETGKIRLQSAMKSRITNLQKVVIKLRPEDIKILVPISVNLKTRGDIKECTVSLRSLALKWFEDRAGMLKLVLVALQTEFIRDYTHGINSQWTIDNFNILECVVLSDSSSISK